MKKIQDLSESDLKDKKVFLRVDFNVPIQLTDNSKQLTETYRIKAYKETIDFLFSAGAKVALVSHVASSFKDIIREIGEILGHQVTFEDDILNPQFNSQLTLFENVRKYEGEQINDSGFAEDLAKNFDVYVNDAFSVSHRKHASVSVITKFLPSYSGFLMAKEVENLDKVINEPAQGKTVILGGAKVATKLPVIKNFLGKAEHILVAGALANTVFKAKGLKIGKSTVEEVEEQIDWNNPKMILPKDIAVSEDKSGETFPEVFPVKDLEENQYILDIGPETIKEFSGIIKNSKTVIFNGPLGLAEIEVFSNGTKTVLDSMIRSGAFTVIGGGDTLALVEKLGLLDKFSYVSTGGGAMLEFLAGNKLPGLGALGYYG
ncbi:MAG: phosphoglycerate kinase [Patescibacteria group bacterium]